MHMGKTTWKSLGWVGANAWVVTAIFGLNAHKVEPESRPFSPFDSCTESRVVYCIY